MNPSAAGWIPKFLTLLDKHQLTNNYTNEIDFYNQLKTTGFLFGISINTLLNKPLSNLTITTAEYTKINLFHSLLFTFFLKNPESNFTDAIKSILDFYNLLEKGKTSFFHKLSLSKTSTAKLEHILAARLQETNSILKKDISSILTYTLLYVDVLIYKKYLSGIIDVKKHEQELEFTIINFCFLALKSKNRKDKFDKQIIELLETSSTYITNQEHQFNAIEYSKNTDNYSEAEKKYMLDLSFLAVWNDKKLDTSEFTFLKNLTKTLSISENEINRNLIFIQNFSKKHSKKIKIFQYTNPINQLYKQSTETVKLLILRNKNRILKELEESGELVVLLGKSTHKELTSQEKNKVKEQLLDICKTVPSLTIFLIPGGSLLLPLLVKYIPSLLPSAFQQNKIESIKKPSN